MYFQPNTFCLYKNSQWSSDLMTLPQIHQNRVCPYSRTMKWHQVNVRRSVLLKIYQESYSKSEWGPGTCVLTDTAKQVQSIVWWDSSPHYNKPVILGPFYCTQTDSTGSLTCSMAKKRKKMWLRPNANVVVLTTAAGLSHKGGVEGKKRHTTPVITLWI